MFVSVERIEQAYISLQKKYVFTEELKSKQVEALHHLINKRDTLAVLPTGYGKSLVFTLLPVLLDEIDNASVRHTVIVVSPLKSLMKDQIRGCQNRGIAAGVLSGDSTKEEREAIFSGQCSVIYGSPESLLKYGSDLADDNFAGKYCALAVDEVHTIVDWTSFRPRFSWLAELKALMGGNQPWGLFSATCDGDLKLAIMKALSIEEVQVVATIPDRPNIYLEVVTGPGMKIERSFQPLVDLMREKKEDTPKCIVYCRTKESTGAVYAFLMSSLQHDAFIGREHGATNRMIEQYSSSYCGIDEERIMRRVLENDSKLRVIVTTIALGMGIDLRDVVQIFHWGVPDNLLRYWQEVGRAGRGGNSAKATLFAYGPSIPRAQKSMRDMLGAIKSGTCIRKTILNSLNISKEPISVLSNPLCCSVCSSTTSQSQL